MYNGHADQHYGHITYSQHGEDLMILNMFSLMGIDKPSYLDLGAHHPENISNTKLLYDRGSRGVNVEANPYLMEAFKKQRPEDINLNIGVGTQCSTKLFYMYDDTSGRNTFSHEETLRLDGVLSVKSVVNMPVITIDMIIRDHCDGKFPDLLTCDIEGLDYAVLESVNLDTNYPKIIVVETRIHEANKMIDMLRDKEFILHCRMGENLIFVHDKYIENVL
jgi:FkbM family methyltransferase